MNNGQATHTDEWKDERMNQPTTVRRQTEFVNDKGHPGEHGQLPFYSATISAQRRGAARRQRTQQDLRGAETFCFRVKSHCDPTPVCWNSGRLPTHIILLCLIGRSIARLVGRSVGRSAQYEQSIAG